jgi:hypothetical protein
VNSAGLAGTLRGQFGAIADRDLLLPKTVGVLLALLSLGCGSKGAVAIVAAVENAHASIDSSSPLASLLKGGFTLHAELGQVAPSGTDVSIQGAMSLVKPDQTSLAVLKLAGAPAPPYHLEPGAKVDATFTITDGARDGQEILPPDQMAICQAGSVQIVGTLTDSATGKPTPVSSASFAVTGCP